MLHTKFKLLKPRKRLVSLLATRMCFRFNLIKHKKEWVKTHSFFAYYLFPAKFQYNLSKKPCTKQENVYVTEISVFRKRLFSFLFTVITRGKTHTFFKLA